VAENHQPAVDDAGGAVTKKKADIHREQYRHSLKQADIECPPPDALPEKAKRGRIKRSKARNLLERLTRYEEDVLRFMENPSVPFTNNRGENDIRMTKVQ
jgi:transposase